MGQQRHEKVRRLLKVTEQICGRARDIFLAVLYWNLKATLLNWVFGEGGALSRSGTRSKGTKIPLSYILWLLLLEPQTEWEEGQKGISDTNDTCTH